MTKIQVQGLCRYSYPSQVGSFANTGQSLDELRAELYDPERLAVRHFFFENVVLPSVKAQTDKDFTLMLLMGENLPDPWRSQLLELICDVPQIKPVFLPEGQQHRLACKEVYLSNRDMSADVVAEFSLDDDDAMAADFVAQTRRAFKMIKPAYERSKRLCLDFSRGFLLSCMDDGTVEYKPVEARLWGCAMAMFLPPDHKRSVLNYLHLRIWRSMPVFMLNEKPMFIRGAHANNDSKIRERDTTEFKYNLEKLPVVAQKKFGIDLEALEAEWARIANQINKG